MKQDYLEVRTELAEEKKKGSFIFLPSPIMNLKDSFFMPLIERVKLREDEIYSAQKKFRIHYNGLLRLSAAACMKWCVDNTRRTDDRSDKTYCSFMAVGGVLGADGIIPWHKAEKEIDLEIIEDELLDSYNDKWDKGDKAKWPLKDFKDKVSFVAAMVRRDMIQHRKNKLTKAESGAKARVVRSVLGIQGTYSNEKDLTERHFVMVHYSQNPNHPEVKKALLSATGPAQNMIYGSHTAQNQIPYYDKDVEKSGGIIDADVFEPEEQSPDSKFQPKTKIENTSLVDFENSGVDDQVKILAGLCKEVGEDFSAHEKDHAEIGGLKGLDQNWRSDFFTYLVTEKDKKA